MHLSTDESESEAIQTRQVRRKPDRKRKRPTNVSKIVPAKWPKLEQTIDKPSIVDESSKRGTETIINNVMGNFFYFSMVITGARSF